MAQSRELEGCGCELRTSKIPAIAGAWRAAGLPAELSWGQPADFWLLASELQEEDRLLPAAPWLGVLC